jgi:hypothetical protein
MHAADSSPPVQDQTCRRWRRTSWRKLAMGFLILGGSAVFAWQLSRSPGPPEVETLPKASPSLHPTPGLPWFEDVTAQSGIQFQHYDSATPMHYIPETMGSGLAWLDYDGDGWPDLFCVQDGPLIPRPGDPQPTCKLYRNNGNGTFTDVTEAVGLAWSGYGMGCAVGDYDNDGYDDLVLTYLGGVVLYHNEPDGKGGRRFVDVTARAGIYNPHWATSCGWGDIDGDGLLDLYICNYVELDLSHYPECLAERTGERLSCPPTAFRHTTHRLFRNNGDGTFTDISLASGIAAAPPAPGLGVVLTDLDGDGWLDIYVANDLKPAYLFHNQGWGRFIEKALLHGCALGYNGALIAGMGVDAGDLDGSGRPSLFVTNFQNEPNILFLNRGRLFFQEASYPSGLGLPSLSRLGFGTIFLDADLDGHLDIAVANGHIQRHAERIHGVPFAQKAQLFRNLGNARFQEVSAQAGPYFQRPLVGRGLAWADFDNDGRPDLAISHNGRSVILLRNATPTTNHWLRLELIGNYKEAYQGKKSSRNAIGARVEIEVAGKRLVRFLNGGGSYLSASERRMLIGLGPARQVERVTVCWPSGRQQVFFNLSADQEWRLYEGQALPQQVEVRRHPG